MLELLSNHVTAALDAPSDSALIMLDQGRVAATSWRLRIRARTPEGTPLLGELVTVPPSLDPAIPTERALAAVYAPGVERWDVEAELLSGPPDGARVFLSCGLEGQGGAGFQPLWRRFETIAIPAAAGATPVAVPIGYHVERIQAFTGGIAGSVQVASHGAAAPIGANSNLTLEPRGTIHGPATVTVTDVGGGVIECVRW